MTSLGDEIRSEAAIADRPGQMKRLEDIAARVDRVVEYADVARRYRQEPDDAGRES